MKKIEPTNLKRHYLDLELENLIQGDPETWNFIREGSLDGVWYWDLENPDQEWMSPEFWKLFGFNPEDMPHSPDAWQDLIFQDDLKVALENFNKHCEDSSHPYDQTVRYKHADGSTVWVRCRGIAIRDEDGKPIRMLGAHNDITSIKEAEEKARREEIIAKHSSDELRSFAYAISHDLKAPANTISALLNEINKSYGKSFDEEMTSLIALCEKTANRMRQLIDDLLGYTRIIGEENVFEMVNLNDVVSGVLSDIQADINAANAEINCEQLPTIYANPAQMRVLMQNLISNAIKFRRPETSPLITIGPISEKGRRREGFRIEDNGIGIAEEFRESIFDIFTRLNLKNQYEGTGLGLAICQRIVMRHKGDIIVGGSSMGGTSFTIKLPKKN